MPAKPLACVAAESAIRTIAQSTCEELGSLSVEVDAPSSAGLLLRGDALSASVTATAISAAGFRANRLTLSAPTIEFDVPTAQAFRSGGRGLGGVSIDQIARPPNLRSPASVSFSVTLTQSDINDSPVIFAALQEILRELLASGVSAAIGEALPRDRSRLVVNLVSVEPPQGGRLVLVADAEAAQSDGSVLRLSGMRVRCTPKVGRDRLLVLDRPELVSCFEGFGAKLEVGLPFLSAAGIPLPEDVALTSLRVADGSITCDGQLTLRPLDYDELLSTAAAAAAAAAPPPASASGQSSSQQRPSRSSWTPDGAVAVDVEAESSDDDDRYTDDERAALRLPPSPR